jgi:RNA polymerase sigma factor (sigma-70 family)
MININKELKKHKGLVISIVNRLKQRTFDYKTYIDWDEAKQIGMIALYNAIMMYNENKGSFKNYAITAIDRAIRRYIDKEKCIENTTDIDEFYNIQEEDRDLDDEIENNKKINILDNIIDTIDCTQKTKQILKLRLRGYSILEIAKEVGDITYQGVYHNIRFHRENIINEFNRRYGNVK